jgi:plastocyanin
VVADAYFNPNVVSRGVARLGPTRSGSVAGLLIGAFLLIIAGGCDKSPSAPAARSVVAPGPGVIRGTVTYAGPPVTPKIIGGECCPGSPPAPDESLVVGPNGGLANVVVSIDDGPNLPPADTTDAVLTQRDCRYVPHVMAVQTGRRILVTSHDPTAHNVHIQPESNPPDNFAELQNASHAVHFDQPDLVRFKCDVHPWMSAFVKVFDHPCFAVTGPDGTFAIDRLPPGTYKLTAWHERLGEQTFTVVVKDGSPVSQDFAYKP